MAVQNISAPFIVQVPPFKAVLNEAMYYMDYLFGNEIEAQALADSEGWADVPLTEVALKVRRRHARAAGWHHVRACVWRGGMAAWQLCIGCPLQCTAGQGALTACTCHERWGRLLPKPQKASGRSLRRPQPPPSVAT